MDNQDDMPSWLASMCRVEGGPWAPNRECETPEYRDENPAQTATQVVGAGVAKPPSGLLSRRIAQKENVPPPVPISVGHPPHPQESELPAWLADDLLLSSSESEADPEPPTLLPAQPAETGEAPRPARKETADWEVARASPMVPAETRESVDHLESVQAEQPPPLDLGLNLSYEELQCPSPYVTGDPEHVDETTPSTPLTEPREDEEGKGDALCPVITPNPQLCIRLARIDLAPPPPPAITTEPIKELPPQRKPRVAASHLKWLSEASLKSIEQGIEGTACKLCGYRTSRRRIRMHTRQHFVRMFCPCTYQNASRDSAYDHQIAHQRTEEHGGHEGRIYMVDEENYPAFCTFMKWQAPPPFGPCRPTNLAKKKAAVTPPATKGGQLNPEVNPTPTIQVLQTKALQVTTQQTIGARTVKAWGTYQIPRKRAAPVTDTERSPTPSPARQPTPPAVRSTARSAECAYSPEESIPSQTQRWRTKTGPNIEVVPKPALDCLERALGRQPLSPNFHHSRRHHRNTLQREVERLEDELRTLRREKTRSSPAGRDAITKEQRIIEKELDRYVAAQRHLRPTVN